MTICDKPHEGWICSRPAGHFGSCAALPTTTTKGWSPGEEGWKVGIRAALAPLTFEEAVKCGFPNPYSAVTSFPPLVKLFELRKKRLLEDV